MPITKPFDEQRIFIEDEELVINDQLAIVLVDDGEHGFYAFGGVFTDLGEIIRCYEEQYQGKYVIGEGTTGWNKEKGIFIFGVKPDGSLYYEVAQIRFVLRNTIVGWGE